MALPVIHDHDGSVDDLLSLSLLLLDQKINLKAVTITPADCFLENALETTQRLLRKANQPHVPIGEGQFYGVNAFPAAWRAKPKILNALPDLINIDIDGFAPVSQLSSAHQLLADQLLHAKEKVTILLTGPCTNLVWALKTNPVLGEKIEQVVWMAGAFEVGGNVATYNHDGSAEWNVFWDPVSAAELLQYQLPITFIPLDVTNHVPVTTEFLKRLALQAEYKWSNLAAQFWATTLDTIPAYEYIYFMWDVLATSYLSIPEAFHLETARIAIIPKGPNAGQTQLADHGPLVRIAKSVELSYFYEYLLTTFRN
jgi:purine nucleosidase